MSRFILAVAASAVAATMTLGAQTSGAAQDPDPAKRPVTVTGCLIQGSSPSVFILDRARLNPEDVTEKPRVYRLVRGTEDLFLQTHVNEEVRLLGVPDGRTAPVPAPGQQIDEKDLPTLTVRGVVKVADRCTAAGER